MPHLARTGKGVETQDSKDQVQVHKGSNVCFCVTAYLRPAVALNPRPDQGPKRLEEEKLRVDPI
jgi:hypothetical protein